MRVKHAGHLPARYRGTEGVQVGLEVVGSAGLAELRQVHRRGVVEVPRCAVGRGLAQQQRSLHLDGHRLDLRDLGEHGVFGGRQHALQPSQQREGQDNPAILRLLEIAPEQVSDD